MVVTCAALVAALGSSCRLKDPEARVTVTNDGVLCLGEQALDLDAGKAFGDIQADHGIPVIVRTNGCLSDRCATDRKASCAVRRDGDKIVVTSSHSWMAPEEIMTCPGTCSPLDARCVVDPLPAGKYTFVLGRRTYPIEVPSRVASGCLTVPKLAPMPVALADGGVGAATGAPPATPLLQPAAVAALATPPTTGAPPSPPPPPRDNICLSTPPPPPAPPPPKKGKAPPPPKPKPAPATISISRANPCNANECEASAPRCVVKRKGNKLTVTTSYGAPGGKPRGPEKAPIAPCTEDCPRLVTQCRTEPIPPGTYTLEALGRSGQVTIPAGSTNCIP